MLKNKLFYLVLLFYCCAINAKPYIPTDKNEVLEQLSVNASLSSASYKNWRAQLSANPNNVDVSVKLARLYIERARDEGDPRYLGYAQAALAPWWHLDKPPIDVIVLRATLYQSTHQFDRSLRDLDSVLRLDPNNAQA